MTFTSLHDSLNKFSLIRVKKNVSKEMSTISSHWVTYNLLKNFTTTLYKIIINQEVDHYYNIIQYLSVPAPVILTQGLC